MDTPSMAIPEMLDAFDAYDPDAQMADYYAGFFDGLSDIDTVIVIGHSLSEVDMEYFEKICSEIHSDAKWIFSCHDSAGLKAINAFVKTMAIGADRVTLFRL